jgi:hypothetical protein
MSALGAVGSMIRQGHEQQGHRRGAGQAGQLRKWMETRMNNIFWIIGVIVVVMVVLGFLGLR